ncbi:MAG TPA: hypothetical protein VEK15_22340 [Vicinamibacteria bacterium]|nr:hypothetical protein [Vicinamibacteria bacterium]
MPVGGATGRDDVHPDGRFLFVVRPESDEDDPYRGLSRYEVVLSWSVSLSG